MFLVLVFETICKAKSAYIIFKQNSDLSPNSIQIKKYTTV